MYNKVHMDTQGRRRVGEGSDRTEYGRVMAALETRIANEFEVGDRIPSTTRLQEQYGASSTAVRRAVRELTSKGLLEGVGGKGVFVIAKPSAHKQDGSPVEGLTGRFVEHIAAIEQRVERLEQADREELQSLRKALGELRKFVNALQVQLIELYGRTGQPFPHELLPENGDSATGEFERRAEGA